MLLQELPELATMLSEVFLDTVDQVQRLFLVMLENRPDILVMPFKPQKRLINIDENEVAADNSGQEEEDRNEIAGLQAKGFASQLEGQPLPIAPGDGPLHLLCHGSPS